jgi:hypothetical protein
MGPALPEANVISLGESSKAGIDQYALLIADDADAQDDGEKNVVLFECAMHAREWYAAESCFWLADYLVNNRNDPVVQELLEQVDVWIIPHTNPAGRDNDDPGLGDPTAYTWFCKGGPNVGKDCASDADCPGIADGCYDQGWRGNAATSNCFAGTDLARNWSSGWNTASSSCTSSDFTTFRGNHPFSTAETRNLRSFVHNHMISMAAVVHSNAQKVGHHWSSTSDAAAWIQDDLWGLNDTAIGAWGDPDPALAEEVTGVGVGQFSGWLTGMRPTSPASWTKARSETFRSCSSSSRSRAASTRRLIRSRPATDRTASIHPATTCRRSTTTRCGRSFSR